jgi:hypothetical protein
MFVALWLLGCAEDPANEACAVDAAPGTASATVDGEPWTGGGATWQWAGESLQLNTVGAGSWWTSLVAQTTTEGATLRAAVDAGAFPITVSLVDGGWATFYPDSGRSFSSQDGDGELVLTEASPNVLGCFWFEAFADAATVTVEEGTIDAEPAP